MYKDPENLDRAVHFVKSALTNQRVILENEKKDAKRVTFQETEIEDCDPDDDHQASACFENGVEEGDIQPWVSMKSD